MTLPAGTPITIGSINCVELMGSAGVTWNGDVMEAERQFICDWDDRFTLVDTLRGSSSVNAAGDTQVRETPATFPGVDRLLCKNVKMMGHGKMDQDVLGDPTYENAHIVAQYRTNTDGDEDDGSDGGDQEAEVIATLDVDYQTEFLAFGSFEAVWVSSDDKIKDPIPRAKLNVILTRQYKQGGLAKIPEAKIKAAIGTVNSAEFNGVAAGRLLLVGAASLKRMKADGSTEYDMTYEVKERTQSTWNEFWNSKRQAWDQIRLIGGAPLAVYSSSNFSELFVDPLAAPSS